ncbi:MAG: ABC transporter ATP-binding protein [Candidatus Eisenbacteria bacterium]|uniref:ABC transporter ATP-binding protein n=1 Tax=Eiseniibacteriota bacterium TaxID=2212470 RepID=A0A9D6L709_UNCEI|nr:ABC transporter ATP-binding protein [Candidatus Eisenbacteria bacterium]MBI3539951.1 ABC transporter ATP-binding protein [Candidatus Eisenbacteria bacterium]
MIDVREVTKRYGAITAVDRLSFDVGPGETFALIGPNGAGKTTTLKLLLGLACPDAGAMRIGRRALPPGDPRARHDIGYVPQRAEFPPARTVGDVLAFFAALRGLPREAVERSLGRVGLTALAPRRASELSGGYVQRLSLAQALLGDPALLVLDEPTASLDPEATWEFRSLVEQLQREGKTLLFCSHLLSEVERIADRVLILVDGRRAALERLDDLRAKQAGATRLAIALLEPPERGIAALAERGIAAQIAGERALEVEATDGGAIAAIEGLRAAGVTIGSFEMRRPTLEETFLAVVHGGADVPR